MLIFLTCDFQDHSRSMNVYAQSIVELHFYYELSEEFSSLPFPLIQSRNKKAKILCHSSVLVGRHFLLYSLIDGINFQKSWFYSMVTGPASYLVWAKNFLFSSSFFIKPKSSGLPNSKWQLTVWFQLCFHFRSLGIFL